MTIRKLPKWILLFTLVITYSGPVLGQDRASLTGAVNDEFGASIVGATITVTSAVGTQSATSSGADGTYYFSGLAAGEYKVSVSAKGFATSGELEVDVVTKRRNILNVTLKVASIQSEVMVGGDGDVSTEPSANADQRLVIGRDLEALPDDPGDLAAALQALAGPSIGPDGGQVVIDGFSSGIMPPRDAIREIRINQNPFAAERDTASGSIEIQTRAGADKFHGSVSSNFNDESLNSRNPLQTDSSKRAPFQVRRLGGNLNGPLKKKKASFYLDFSRNETDDNELVRATVLDSSLNPLSLSQLTFTPRRITVFSQRVDYAINTKDNLVERYSYNRDFSPTTGIGGFSLPERSIRQISSTHLFQLTDTAVLNTNLVNETRLQYLHNQVEASAASSNPTLNVDGSFVGGGSSVGHQLSTTNRWELQNITQILRGNHSVKFGGRFRIVTIKDINPANFNGQWTFAGGSGGLTSLERYRRTLQLQELNLTPEQIRAAGGGVAQFSISIGNPLATVRQFDLEPFAQDDWRARPNLTVSYGLRYEIQNHASSLMGFAPRLAIAWSPGTVTNSHAPRTVIRAGAGIFYRRFGEISTLNVNHFNGSNVQQFIFSESTNSAIPTDPFTLGVLNSFRCVDGSTTPDCITSLPSLVGAKPVTQTVWRVAPGLRVPAIYLFGTQVERQLPHNFTVVLGANARRVVHAIRIRDINAPIPGTITEENPSGTRPNAAVGEINQFEGAGRFHVEQFVVSFKSRLNAHFSLDGSYSVNKAMSDTDGQDGGDIPGVPRFPHSSYDVQTDWGVAAYDVRQYFSLFGTYSNPKLWKLNFAPFIVARSGYPFNITTGIDSNLDHQFTDRPSFAGPNANCASPVIRCTRYGNFTLIPNPGEKIIPRNFGRGPAVFLLNLRVSRSFGFSNVSKASAKAASEKKYSLTISTAIQNLLNKVNLAVPVGNLSSPLFGQAQGLTGFGGIGGGSADAGNRRIFINAQFSF